MSNLEGQSFLQQKPKARKGSVHFEDEGQPTGGQNTTKDAQALANRLQFSPKGYATSNVPFFCDPTMEREIEGPECAEVTLNCTNKYFSTPITSKGRAKKKLSPVMEADTESNPAPEDKACPMGSVHKSPEDADPVLCQSSLESPPFRNSFAMECQEIIKQIKGAESNNWSPGKRKAEELDVSVIDAEPPPYDSTPFKSMLAWEDSHMISSLESSPVNYSTSLFGVSLLDLEGTDMQLQDFNLSELSNKNGKGQSACDSVVKEIFYLGDKKESSIKRQKLSPLSDVFYCESKLASTANCSPACVTGKAMTPHHESLTSGTSLVMEELHVANITEALKYDEAGTLPDITSHCPEVVNEDYVNKPCASTTQDIYEPANTTQVIESLPQQFSMLNAIEVIEPSPQSICNVTQDIALVTNDNGRENTTTERNAAPQTMQQTVSILDDIAAAANTTWVLEEETPTSAAQTEQELLANTTQVMGPPAVADTTQDIVPKHEGSLTNTTQVIEVLPECSPNTMGETVTAQESSKSANTTQVISPVPGDSANRTQDIVMVQDDGAEKGNGTVNIALPEVTAEVTDPVNEVMTDCVSATKDIAQDGNVDKTAPSPDLPPIVPKDTSASGDVFSNTGDESPVPSSEGFIDHIVSPDVLQTSALTPDVVNESRKLPRSPKDSSRNISGCSLSPEKEVMIPNIADHIYVAHAEGQTPVSDVTHTSTGRTTPVSISEENKPDSQDGARNKEENDVQSCALGSSLSEMPPSKAAKGRLLALESCSMIQEEENVHDVSVFSAGSLSFVTSTPVPGLNNFQFQKACKDSEQHDPNISHGSVMDLPQKKVLTEDCLTAQSKVKASMEGHKQIKGLPSNLPRTGIPSQMSAIPSARRSLALFHIPAGQNLGKEPPLSKIPPKGITGKAMTRPLLARQSLPRASLGNAKQTMEGKVGILAPSKIAGSAFKTPKVAAAKPRSALPTKLPRAPPLGNAPSQLCTPSSGVQNVTADVPDPASVSHAAPPTGVKSFLPKPGSSSLHPSLPLSSQKTLLKPKSNLPGRKSQLVLGSQKKIVPVKGEGSLIKKQLKPPLSVLQAAPTKEVISKVAGKPNIPTARTQLIKAEPSGESSNLPTPFTDEADPESCCNLETCKCCQRWLKRCKILLQENEDLKRQLGQTHHENDC